jgi:hypothetical protein
MLRRDINIHPKNAQCVIVGVDALVSSCFMLVWIIYYVIISIKDPCSSKRSAINFDALCLLFYRYMTFIVISQSFWEEFIKQKGGCVYFFCSMLLSDRYFEGQYHTTSYH